jgi:hypothetical protein
MATVFNTTTAGSQREDLANFISNIVRDETPFMSSIGKTSAKALLHSWSTDTLAVPGDNNAAEGAGFPGTVSTGPVLVQLTNQTQIFTKSIEVSGSVEAVDKAGRKSEFKYQSTKRGKELMRDIEWALTTGKAVRTTSGNRKFGGFQSWVPAGNTVNASGGAITAGAADGTNVPVSAGSAAAFSLSQVDQVMQNCYENGGRPNVLMMSPRVKRLFSTAAQGQAANGNVRRNIDDTGKLRQSVEIYETDFGVVKVVPNYVMGATGSGAGAANAAADDNVLVYDATTFKMAVLRPLHHRDISEDGDRLRALMVHETTLECSNPAANGLIDNLS